MSDPAPDYYEVRYLKKNEQGGWSPQVDCFPTKALADDQAEKLSHGNQGAVRVIPRQWA